MSCGYNPSVQGPLETSSSDEEIMFISLCAGVDLIIRQ